MVHFKIPMPPMGVLGLALLITVIMGPPLAVAVFMLRLYGWLP